MTELVDFLLSAIADDERLAHACAATDWRSVGYGSVVNRDTDGWRMAPDAARVLTEQADDSGSGAADHAAQWDPNRVLAECDAKRRIIELHQPRGGYTPPDSWYGNRNECDSCGGYELVAGMGARGHRASWPCPTLRQLARPYADRPGYREEWRPT